MLRCLIGFAAFFLMFAAQGTKTARAATLQDVPASIKLTDTANSAFMPASQHASLFGAGEKESTNIEPFTKWSDMFRRLQNATSDPSARPILAQWKENLESIRGLPLMEMATKVNNMINSHPYIEDTINWHKSDYWETPVEFLTRGGDCEDFAIAKYVSLRALGVPEDRLRITVLQDVKKGIPHAVLALYTDDDVVILDNQIKTIRSSEDIGHYKPIFSINRTAWWLHTDSASTLVASAAR